MLNTYHYCSPGGFAAAACLAGALLHYSLTHSPTSSVLLKTTETLEVSDRGSGRLTTELLKTREEEVEIAHRGSGRVLPARL